MPLGIFSVEPLPILLPISNPCKPSGYLEGTVPVEILGKANLLHDCRLPPAIPESSGGKELGDDQIGPPARLWVS